MEDLIIGSDTAGTAKRDGQSLDEQRNILIRARQAYYHGDSPIMSDREYDALEARFARKCPDDPILKLVGAPFNPDSLLDKVQHPDYARNGSQFKITDPDPAGLGEWLDKFSNEVITGSFHCSFKGDGGSLALYYANGVLVQALTRGDGFEGEDVTANAVKMKNVPTQLPEPFTGQVRAEVVMTMEDWEKVDPDMTTNPRNVGNGIMGRSNGHQVEYLTVLATDMRPAGEGCFDPAGEVSVNIITTTEKEKFETLERLGFEPVEWDVCSTPEAVIDFYKQTTKRRPDLDYWIDGVVVRIDDIARQEALGERDNRPKGQVAWKFKDQGAKSVLESVELTVGHTGTVVPTANLKPVQIGGTTVSRALLCNWEEIERLGIAVGDEIEVVKAGDIIPKITEVLSRPESREPIEAPTMCPVCGGAVEKVGANHICQNPECDAKGLGKIKRWIKSLNVLHFGDKLIDGLYSNGDVQCIADLYTLEVEHLANTPINDSMLLGDKRAQTAYDNLHARKSLPVHEFFGSLGVQHLGKRRAEKMIEAAPELQNWLCWIDGTLLTVGEKAGVPGVAATMNAALEGNERIMALVGLVGIDDKPQEKVKLEGKTFCITGSLPSGKKKGDYKAPLASNGHELVNSVTKSLDILVIADPSANTGKAKKAKDYGIEVISEEELQTYL